MITWQEQPYAEEEIYEDLHPLVEKWFKSNFESFALAQKYAIRNIHLRQNTLVSAPTGSGKTLTAFLSIINELVCHAYNSELEDKIYCVYVSPLKALNNDIEKNLQKPLKELEEMCGEELGIRVGVRTGDTTSYEKQKMLRNPPHILITTPETLSIVLNAPKFKNHLKDVKWLIADEIHSLAENKRGVHFSLSVERLQEMAGKFCRIGLSATISPLEEIAKFLVGYEQGKLRDCKIVDVNFVKDLDLKVMTPVPSIINATQKQLQDEMYKLVSNLIDEHKTTLIFTNTRSATERVVHNLKEKYPSQFNDDIGAHHSSLSREQRLMIENRLKDGKLKCVVSSTSLELGIDIGYIDLVILLGSPKSVARALQRVGRSGHKLHATAKGRIVVTDRDDLMECSVLLKNALEGNIDRVQIPENALDVLSQQIYGVCINNVRNIDNVYHLVKRSYCYRNLKREDFDSVVSYLAGEYVGLEQRHVYAKIWTNYEENVMGKRGKLARVMYSTNVGTIPDETSVSVKIGKEKVGSIEEAFLEKLKKGDIFVLGGNTYRFLYSRGQTAQVRPAPGNVPTVPAWFSEMLPLSYDLAMEIGRFRRLIEERLDSDKSKKEILDFIHDFLYVDDNSAEAIYEYMREQYKYVGLPTDRRIIVEHYTGFRNEKYLIFHTMFGRRTNDALSRAIAFMVSKKSARDVGISLMDNGFYITAGEKKMQVKPAINELKNWDLRTVLRKAIDKSEVLLRRFRHCATRSLMILRRYKGRKKSVGRQQVGSRILMSFLRKMDPDFPILREARREVMEDFMDLYHASKILHRIRKGKIEIKYVSTEVPSPFAFNLIAQGYMDILRMEDRMEFIRRLHQAVLDRIGEGDKEVAEDAKPSPY